MLIRVAIPPAAGSPRGRPPVDVRGAVLCRAGLAGPVFALIEQPRLGWSSPAVFGSLLGRRAAAVRVRLPTRRAPRDPMLPLRLFRRRNFSAGNVETFAMYAGLSVLFFFLVLFLQQVGGYTPLQSGLATLPVTLVMFVLSRRFGRLADRYGPRLFMGAGPLAGRRRAAAVPARRARTSTTSPSVLPAVLVFALGLSMTVAPLTAAVLAGSEHEAGHRLGRQQRGRPRRRPARDGRRRRDRRAALRLEPRSAPRRTRASAPPRTPRCAQAKRLPLGRPNVQRPAARTARTRSSQAAEAASLHSFHLGIAVAAALVAVGGLIGVAGIRNPRREVAAAECPGGALVGASCLGVRTPGGARLATAAAA